VLPPLSHWHHFHETKALEKFTLVIRARFIVSVLLLQILDGLFVRRRFEKKLQPSPIQEDQVDVQLELLDENKFHVPERTELRIANLRRYLLSRHTSTPKSKLFPDNSTTGLTNPGFSRLLDSVTTPAGTMAVTSVTPLLVHRLTLSFLTSTHARNTSRPV
jgi:hypothetical protein